VNPVAGLAVQDPVLTPGVTSSAVTQENIHSTICVSGYTATVRNVSSATKARVYAEYGITSHAPGSYEVDHLIPLELGGSNDIENLWPEPYTGADNAHDKDHWENALHAMVCNGEMSLAEAQQKIVQWWLLLGATASNSSSPSGGGSPTQNNSPRTGSSGSGSSSGTSVHPGSYCAPVGAHGTYNGRSYVCSKTKADGTPYSGGRARWRRG
jgi:hypothetical protein